MVEVPGFGRMSNFNAFFAIMFIHPFAKRMEREKERKRGERKRTR